MSRKNNPHNFSVWSKPHAPSKPVKPEEPKEFVEEKTFHMLYQKELSRYAEISFNSLIPENFTDDLKKLVLKLDVDGYDDDYTVTLSCGTETVELVPNKNLKDQQRYYKNTLAYYEEKLEQYHKDKEAYPQLLKDWEKFCEDEKEKQRQRDIKNAFKTLKKHGLQLQSTLGVPDAKE